MRSFCNEEDAAGRAARSKLSKLFKVLVVGGAALAMASALTIRGSTGAASARQTDEPKDGGTQGW
jgi:hypothetical protein